MKKQRIRLFHASHTKNHKSIMKSGLRTGMISSGYGKVPEHDAIYLYYINNEDVPCDLIQTFDNHMIDVYEVHDLDERKLIADEDSSQDNWIDSVESMGTCAYTDNISKSKITFIGRFKSEVEYLAWVKIEKKGV